MKKIQVLLFTMILLLVVAACGSTNDNNSNNNNANESGDPAESETVTITHELGETDVPKNPENIVVFDFGILDSLDYLNIDVVGVPQMNIPAYLEKYTDEQYENIGSLKEPDFEKISQIDPDLIIISGRQAELYDELSKLGPVIYLGVDTSRYIDSFKENMEVLGEIFDKTEEIDSELAEIDSKINELSEKAQSTDKTGLILLANDNNISAYGISSRFGIIHDVFGIPAADEEIEVSTHGMSVTFEYVLETNPDILYVIDRSAAIGEEPAAKGLIENDLIKNTIAMQNDDIVYLNPDVWYLSGGGIASVQEMIKEISDSLE